MRVQLALTRLDSRRSQSKDDLSSQYPARHAIVSMSALHFSFVSIDLRRSRRKAPRRPPDGPDDASYQNARRSDQARSARTVIIDNDACQDGQDPVDQRVCRSDRPVPSVVDSRDLFTDGTLQRREGRLGKVAADYVARCGKGEDVLDSGISYVCVQPDLRVRKMIHVKAGPLYFHGLSTPPADAYGSNSSSPSSPTTGLFPAVGPLS